MRARTWMTLIVVVIVGAWQGGGCISIIPPINLDFNLGGTLGTIDVVDGVGETQGTGTYDTSKVNIASGSIRLDPSVISIEDPAISDTAKGNTALQLSEELSAACTGEPLIVNVWVGTPEQVATVFDDGEHYGPFEITLDENCEPTAVSPASVTLTPTTVDLLDSGSVSIGIRVESPVDGTVVIDSISFTVRISL